MVPSPRRWWRPVVAAVFVTTLHETFAAKAAPGDDNKHVVRLIRSEGSEISSARNVERRQRRHQKGGALIADSIADDARASRHQSAEGTGNTGSMCYNGKDIASIAPKFAAGSIYWAGRCQVIAPDTTMIKVTSGSVVDYFRPIDGASWCDMMTSDRKHAWFNPTTSTWETAVSPGDTCDGIQGLGGSCDYTTLATTGAAGPSKRKFLLYWGHLSQEGACCADAEPSSRSDDTSDPTVEGSWGLKTVVTACSRCQTLKVVGGGLQAAAAYWDALCPSSTAANAIAGSASMIRISMGSVVDYFKPVAGADICSMLKSNIKHQWSPDGESWVTPTYYDTDLNHYGGSAEDWPKNNVPGDNRKYLSFWGSSSSAGKTGGCCSATLAGDCRFPNTSSFANHCFNRAYTIDYCM